MRRPLLALFITVIATLMVATLTVGLLVRTVSQAQAERVEPIAASDAPPMLDATQFPPFDQVVRWYLADRDAKIVAWYEALVQAQQEAEAKWAAAAAVPRQSRTAPEVVPESSPAPTGDVAQIIYDVFGQNGARAVRIAECESGLNPYARNRSGALGLFQLLGHGDMFAAHGWNVETDWSDPYKNAMVAFDLSHGGTNWSAWVCR